MTRNALVLLAAGGSAALLIGAYIFQALGYAPCALCLAPALPALRGRRPPGSWRC
jgi:disulfide bond formation protein DsbB